MTQLPTIILIKDACPICHGDVRGNDEYKYLCIECKILFNFKDLQIKKEEYVEHAPQSIKGIAKEILENKFIVSLRSNKYHWINCPYIRKILEENLFYFNFEADAKENEYEPCVCMKNRIMTGFSFVMAKEGTDYHSPNCPFAGNIKEENRIYFDDETQAQDRTRCKCLRDKKRQERRVQSVDKESQERKLEQIKEEKNDKETPSNHLG